MPTEALLAFFVDRSLGAAGFGGGSLRSIAACSVTMLSFMELRLGSGGSSIRSRLGGLKSGNVFAEPIG